MRQQFYTDECGVVESFPEALTDSDCIDLMDAYRYVPDDLEESEALEFFDAHPVEAFEAWVCGLPSTMFCEVSRSLAILRDAIVRYHAEKDGSAVTVRDVLLSL